MIIPVRCFSCGKTLANKYDKFVERCRELEAKAAKEESEEVAREHKSFDRVSKNALLNEMGLERYCCRRHMLCQVDMMEII
jgi:DNA-directed RNA polymerase subunit N (RpoN/RPB10)